MKGDKRQNVSSGKTQMSVIFSIQIQHLRESVTLFRTLILIQYWYQNNAWTI